MLFGRDPRSKAVLERAMKQVETVLREMQKEGKDLIQLKFKKYQKTHYTDCHCAQCLEAKRLNDRIQPTARVFYADPFVDMHNRMKEALVLLGKLPRAVVRPPLVKLERAEVARIRQALIEAGLLDKSARDAA